MQVASARPYNLISGTDSNRDGQALAAYSRDEYIDPATGLPVGMNSQRGRASFNFDSRITKSFNLRSESRKLGLFVELYNITNRANFGQSFSGNGLAVNFKQPTGFMPGLPNARQIQYGARFSF